MDWTSDLIQRLRDLWAEGHSTAEIGRRMGITKSAVVGKAHRLDLDGRQSPIRSRDPNALPPVSKPPHAGKVTLPPLPSSAPVPTPPKPIFHAPAVTAPEPIPSRPKRHRDGTGCSYPIGEPGTKAFRFCDADLVSASYCREHYRLCCRRVAA